MAINQNHHEECDNVIKTSMSGEFPLQKGRHTELWYFCQTKHTVDKTAELSVI